MLFGYTQMDRIGTRLMRLLGIPTYFCSVVLALISPFNRSIAAWIIAIAACFLYEYGYCKVLVAYTRKDSQPYLATWIMLVLLFQTVAIGLSILLYHTFLSVL